MGTDNKKTDNNKKTLSLSSKGTLGVKSLSSGSGTDGGPPPVKRNRASSVTVEVKRKQVPGSAFSKRLGNQEKSSDADSAFANLSPQEREARAKALEASKKKQEQKAQEEINAPADTADTAVDTAASTETENKETTDKKQSQRSKELEELNKIKEAERLAQAGKQNNKTDQVKRKFSKPAPSPGDEQEQPEKKKTRLAPREEKDDWGGGKLTVNQALNYEYEIEQRQRSLAAQRRARQKEKRKMAQESEPQEAVKQVRKVVVPETITVGELAKRMTEKTTDIIKFLMQMDVMATQNQSIDADTAELVVTEFGHKIQRVTDADVEIDIEDKEDNAKDLVSRAPVVTIMGHVDHGKTSILDALRETDVVSGEAGGITQHIGAYQVTLTDDRKITFLDTPGHAAFTEMRARGANVTDIVVLVVAANDSIMPQTIEAINHAKAADVPVIVAINKCDLPEANPQKVKEDLLQHEVIVEDYSGDVQAIEVSAMAKTGLDKLEEAILLQAELLELKANPNREGRGVVVEAKLDKGRGSVATILVEKGTIKIGDIFICGKESGRIRALVDARGQNLEEAGPSMPVEIIGLNATPMAGDDFVVVESDSKAREIADYRQRLSKDKAALAAMSSVEQLFAQAKEGEKKILSIVLKADVHGSVEAIQGALKKLSEDSEASEEVDIRVIHSGVGEITEADITLANASNGAIIGFNVRANAQARDKAKRDGREIRYYSIIYNVIDDMKALVGGLLSPVIKEDFIGYAEIREVFNISKVGKVAGCMITDGFVKRGANVRLLRDNIVIHEGALKTLRRFKEEVKEVREGTECGMAFENYDDIKEGDMIECFEVTEEARVLS